MLGCYLSAIARSGCLPSATRAAPKTTAGPNTPSGALGVGWSAGPAGKACWTPHTQTQMHGVYIRRMVIRALYLIVPDLFI